MISTTTTSATMMMTAPARPDDHDTQPHRIDAGAPALVSTPLFIFHFFLYPTMTSPQSQLLRWPAPAPAYQRQHATIGEYFFLCR